VSTGCP